MKTYIHTGRVDSQTQPKATQRKKTSPTHPKTSSPSAPPTPPLTGASTISKPLSTACTAKAFEATGSIVLPSTSNVPSLA